MVLAVLMAIYQFAGGIVLFNLGTYFFYHYPEVQIYGGYAMAQGAMCIISLIAFSNKSYLFATLLFRVYPIILLAGAIRGGVMAWELQYYQDVLKQECTLGDGAPSPNITTTDTGTPTTVSAQTTGSIPSTFCSVGIHNFDIVFTAALIVDFILMSYLYFMIWRFHVRLRKYVINAFEGGLYTA